MGPSQDLIFFAIFRLDFGIFENSYLHRLVTRTGGDKFSSLTGSNDNGHHRRLTLQGPKPAVMGVLEPVVNTCSVVVWATRWLRI